MFSFHSESFADITFDIRCFKSEIPNSNPNPVNNMVLCYMFYYTTPLAVTLLKYETKPQNEH